LGYKAPPTDTYDAFGYQNEYHDWAEQTLRKEEYREQVSLGQPSLIFFEHRESPEYMETRDPFGQPTPNDPPTNISGMVSVDLDPQGRLIRFLGVPPQLDDGAPAQPMDWKKLFDAAGLDPSRWTEAASQETPPYSFDERKAWTGTFAHAPDMPMRIDAAAWRGRPVSFELFGPWSQPVSMHPQTPRVTGLPSGGWIGVIVILIALAGAVWLAGRNFRTGRGDTRGALRLAVYALIFQSTSEIVRLHHVPTVAELVHITYQLSIGLCVAAGTWVLYIALEPYLRRRWPQSLISWTRLLAGDARDPLVAGHILAGIALGVGFTLVLDLSNLVAWQSFGRMSLGGYTTRVLDPAGLAGWLLWNMIGPIFLALITFFIFFLLRLVLRNTWAAAAVCVVLDGLANLSAPDPFLSAVLGMMLISSGLWVMIRFGILPLALLILLELVGLQAPLTSDLSAWYASKGLIVVALILGLAVWSFRNALGGRKVIKEDFLEQ
jgi:serine/threonine-protein kinase